MYKIYTYRGIGNNSAVKRSDCIVLLFDASVKFSVVLREVFVVVCVNSLFLEVPRPGNFNRCFEYLDHSRSEHRWGPYYQPTNRSGSADTANPKQ